MVINLRLFHTIHFVNCIACLQWAEEDPKIISKPHHSPTGCINYQHLPEAIIHV